jgi:hypothetical protein
MAGALLFLAGAQSLMFNGVEPFASWFYPFAWWSYIACADTLVFSLKGESLIRTRTREFLVMLPWSVFVWLIFELFNLSLRNWYYINVTGIWWVRWTGYVLAYATVLPGVFVTAELLEVLGLFRGAGIRPWRVKSSWYPWLWGLGILSAALPLLWPRYLFPLVWGAFVFGLEPFLHRAGAPSLLADMEKGDPRRALILLSSGLACGFLWEFWNFWARTKWVYAVPYFTELKVFEMPVAGFLGFPPFALECFTMYSFIRLCMGWAGEAERRTSLARALAATAILAVTYGLTFSAIDSQTILSWVH